MNTGLVSTALKWGRSALFGAMGMVATFAYADSISPTSFAATLGVGESVTITKTVTVTKAPPTTAPLDVMFVFDTTGSMDGAIATAKTAASDILTGLAGFGSLHSGVAFYNDPGHGITAALSASTAATDAAIGALGASGGGDFEELGWAGIGTTAATSPWRPGSSRYIIVFGDASFKDGEGFTAATSAAAVAGIGAKVIGLDFAGGPPSAFATDIGTYAGSSVVAGATSPADLVADIIAGVGAGFSTYTTVGVDDLGGGGPEISVASVCLTADIGSCAADLASGAYDRSVDRTFTFATTFTRTAAGDKSFETFGLVDGKIVASERDEFKMPEPTSLALVGLSLLGLGFASRRRA